MSGIYNGDAPRFANSPAKSTLTAFFDSRSEAESAIAKLTAAGIADVRLMPGNEADGEGAHAAANGSSFWSLLEDWLFPDEDRDVYAEGLRRGGFLVSASVDESSHDTAHGILDDEGSIDLDERADLWRKEGWTTGGGQQAAASKEDVFQADATVNAATGAGLYSRSAQAASPRVRGYDLAEDLPDNVVDDVLPTGHQRDVSDDDRSVGDSVSQNQSTNDLRRV